MSHRTQSLQPLSGLPHVIRELRYHEASRQLIGILLVICFAALAQPVPWLLFLATPFALLGVGVRLWASGYIIKNRVLATSGPYAYARHPLYLGNILIIASFVVASGAWWAVAVAIAFLAFYYPSAIEYEDRKLRALFGIEWQEFAARTPALFPARRRPSVDTEGGRWSLAKSMTNNIEGAVSIFLLVCFFFMYTRL